MNSSFPRNRARVVLGMSNRTEFLQTPERSKSVPVSSRRPNETGSIDQNGKPGDSMRSVTLKGVSRFPSITKRDGSFSITDPTLGATGTMPTLGRVITDKDTTINFHSPLSQSLNASRNGFLNQLRADANATRHLGKSNSGFNVLVQRDPAPESDSNSSSTGDLERTAHWPPSTTSQYSVIRTRNTQPTVSPAASQPRSRSISTGPDSVDHHSVYLNSMIPGVLIRGRSTEDAPSAAVVGDWSRTSSSLHVPHRREHTKYPDTSGVIVPEAGTSQYANDGERLQTLRTSKNSLISVVSGDEQLKERARQRASRLAELESRVLATYAQEEQEAHERDERRIRGITRQQERYENAFNNSRHLRITKSSAMFPSALVPQAS